MRTGHISPRGPSAGWWVLKTTNAAGTNGITCIPKHGEVRDSKFLVTHTIYYYQFNLYMYDLVMFICYLVSITQVLKDT
jgi:hypothetical protein